MSERRLRTKEHDAAPVRGRAARRWIAISAPANDNRPPALLIIARLAVALGTVALLASGIVFLLN